MARAVDPNKPAAILESARQVFLRDGVASAHMTDIAAGAGIAVGTLYLYFSSKDAILGALAAEAFVRAARVIDPILARPLTRTSLARLVRGVFDAVLADQSLSVLHIAAVSDVFPTLAPSAYAELVTAIATRLEAQMEWNRVRRYDPHTLADMLVILLRRAVLHAVAHPEREREPYESTLVTLLSVAILADRSVKHIR